MSNPLIYLIENLINGKWYVGKTTTSLKKRWYYHLYDVKKGSTTKLHNAIRKYGVNNFKMFVMENVCDVVKIDDREKYWIKVLDTKKDGYNMTDGGEGGLIGTGQLGKHWKIKDTSNMKGTKTVTEEVLEGRKAISGKNNYQFKGYAVTPWGTFESLTEASIVANEERSSGNNLVVTDALGKYLNNLDVPLNPKGRRTPKLWRGKTPRELGFDFIKVEKDE